MRVLENLRNVPTTENCTLPHNPNFRKEIILECKVWKEQLERVFTKSEEKGLFFLLSKDMAGTPYVAISYNNGDVNQLVELEDILTNLPEIWDEKSVEKLKSGGYKFEDHL